VFTTFVLPESEAPSKSEPHQGKKFWLKKRMAITMEEKTFTLYINSLLQKHGIQITNLTEDLRDGIVLIHLAQELTGQKVSNINHTSTPIFVPTHSLFGETVGFTQICRFPLQNTTPLTLKRLFFFTAQVNLLT
jgi:hypothetical protein